MTYISQPPNTKQNLRYLFNFLLFATAFLPFALLSNNSGLAVYIGSITAATYRLYCAPWEIELLGDRLDLYLKGFLFLSATIGVIITASFSIQAVIYYPQITEQAYRLGLRKRALIANYNDRCSKVLISYGIWSLVFYLLRWGMLALIAKKVASPAVFLAPAFCVVFTTLCFMYAGLLAARALVYFYYKEDRDRCVESKI